MGDEYAIALGESLRISKYKTKNLNLANNRLTDAGAVPLIGNVSAELLDFDLSFNPKITIETCRVLADALTDRCARLRSA